MSHHRTSLGAASNSNGRKNDQTLFVSPRNILRHIHLIRTWTACLIHPDIKSKNSLVEVKSMNNCKCSGYFGGDYHSHPNTMPTWTPDKNFLPKRYLPRKLTRAVFHFDVVFLPVRSAEPCSPSPFQVQQSKVTEFGPQVLPCCFVKKAGAALAVVAVCGAHSAS